MRSTVKNASQDDDTLSFTTYFGAVALRIYRISIRIHFSNSLYNMRTTLTQIRGKFDSVAEKKLNNFGCRTQDTKKCVIFVHI